MNHELRNHIRRLLGRLAITVGILSMEKVWAQESVPGQTNVNQAVIRSQSLTNNPGWNFIGRNADDSHVPVNLRPFQLVLPQAHGLGDWFGVRPAAESNGITPSVTFVSDMAGNVSGGRSTGFAEADNLGIDLLVDLDRWLDLPGSSFHISASQRSGTSISEDRIGNVFTVQQVYGGDFFHLIDLSFQQKALDDRLEFVIGRIAAGDDFLVSPADYVFIQNGFDGNPVGIFFNAPGMTAYPNAAWGTRLKFKPTPRTYVMAGVYDGNTAIRASAYNGADFSLDGPLFVMVEAGYEHNGLPGDSKFIGNYKIGFWYDNHRFDDYNSLGFDTPAHTERGSWGLYGLFDQVVVTFGPPEDDRGVGLTGSLTVAPDQSVSQMPYFATAGIICRGLIPARSQDLLALGVVYGKFSGDLQAAETRESQNNPLVVAQDYESVAELTYRFRFHKNSLFFQPDLQCILHPGGSTKYNTALVLGCQIGINF